MADGKTIVGVRANQAASLAFRKILIVRLAFAASRIQSLDGHADTVHQLRVGTRRASAAIKLMEQALPAKRRDKMLDLLRHLRRAAGPVRDIDIYLETVHAAAVTDHAKDFLTGHMAYSRAAALERLKQLASEALPEVKKGSTNLLASVDGRLREPFGDLLAAVRKKMTRKFNFALEEAAQKLTVRHLHALRIRGKRLRYTLELLPDPADRSIKLIEDLQKILGDWHDAHIMAGHLAGAKVAAGAVNGSAGSPVMKGILTLEKHAAKAEAAKLALLKKWIKSWQSAAKRQKAVVS